MKKLKNEKELLKKAILEGVKYAEGGRLLNLKQRIQPMKKLNIFIVYPSLIS
ncbi:MAG: hypothetical protein LC437_06670 [Thiohalomonas sp.]|nr:hypothetical protein [Thiohalomonas sp.]